MIVVILVGDWGFRHLVMILVVPLLVVLVVVPADLVVSLVIVALVLILSALILVVAEVLVVLDGVIIATVSWSRRIIVLAVYIHPTFNPFVPRPVDWAIIISFKAFLGFLVFLVLL